MCFENHYKTIIKLLYLKTIIDLRKRESFWQLDTVQPNGLNECEVALF